MDNQNRYNLITRGLQEVIGGEILQQILAEGRTLKCCWGTAPTGRCTGMAGDMESNSVIAYIAYFVALLRFANFPPSWSRNEPLSILERS